MCPVLSMEKLGFRYGENWALKEIDIRVRPGELLGIMGPNGSGKSTLLKVADGILSPQEGQAILKGHFGGGVSPVGLFRAAAVPTLIVFGMFTLFS